MAPPTPQERDAFLWMQGRMVELLLRHRAERLGALFWEQEADPHDDPRLARYRDLAVLFYLRDDLFHSILPRIRRRLSFEAPRELLLEEPPTRGRIDWARTTAATWRDRPGEVPLELYTRQRRRHFSTPENLLVVATLLEYRSAVQTLLDAEAERDSAQALRHAFHDIVDACTRELVFPQFAGLVPEAEEILAGRTDVSVEALEEAVAENLLPGRNSAYDDLLEWRHRLRSLLLLNRTHEQEEQPMLGASPQRDNYLYQIWLFYEVGEFLQRRSALRSWDHARMVLTFTWGSGEDERTYRLQHDQQIAHAKAYWQGAPGARPDFYIEHIEPLEVTDDNRVLWREPGYVLDAKYYKPRDTPKAPASPIKRMIADLQLTGERHGALLFAFHGGPLEPLNAPEEAEEDALPTAAESVPQPALFTSILPQPALAHTVQPDVHVDIWRLQPSPEGGEDALHSSFTSLLNEVHLALRHRTAVRCHGIFFDGLSANAHGTLSAFTELRSRTGQSLVGEADDLLLCPKPHVAAWRVDLVHHNQCCRDPSVCHVIGQPGVRPPQRLTRFEEITHALRESAALAESSDGLVQRATEQVLVITKRYADLLQPNIADFQRWVQEELEIGDLFLTTPLLTPAQRETLALGRFLWEQIEHIKSSNFAGPTLLFTGVLEDVTRVTIYKVIGKPTTAEGRPLQDTLGTLGSSKEYGGYVWSVLEEKVERRGYWNEQVSTDHPLTLSDWIEKVWKISSIRNNAAHHAFITRKAFRSFCTLFFGGSGTEMGVLNGLLLAWNERELLKDKEVMRRVSSE